MRAGDVGLRCFLKNNSYLYETQKRWICNRFVMENYFVRMDAGWDVV